MQDLSYPSAQRMAQAQLQSKASSGNFRVLRLRRLFIPALVRQYFEVSTPSAFCCVCVFGFLSDFLLREMVSNIAASPFGCKG
ncbi:hypothetical protein WN943_008231 [Citrus x changshan-huyou]